MKKDSSKLRLELWHNEGARRSHVEKIMQERGPLRRGSFVTIRRKCGKPNCRCAEGEGHPAKYLSVKEGGRTKMIYVPPGKEVQVASEAGHYRRLRQHRAMLAKLSFQSLALIDELTGALESKEAIPRRKANRSKARSRSRRSKRKGG